MRRPRRPTLPARSIAPLALLLLSGPSAGARDAARQPGYLMVRCIKTLPRMAGEYEKFMLETTARSMQVRANEGDIDGWVFAKTVIPSGGDTDCDYMQMNVHRRFPPERTPVDPYFVKANVKVTRDQWYEKLGQQSRLSRLEMWEAVEDLGTMEKGNYLRVDYFRVQPGKLTDWVDRAALVTRPIQQLRIQSGQIKGWQAQQILLPGGSSRPYNARTLIAFPSWEAIGQWLRVPDQELAARAHPGKNPARLLERAGQSQELVRSELFKIVEAVRPVTPAPAAH